MNQLPYWPVASLLLVPVVLYLGLRAYFVLLARFDHERRNVQQISELHLATIEALARAIDAKDGTAENHIRRVQIYATAVAREMGMSEEEVQAVKTAALLHDIGKLAVPDHILAKPGPLTPEEFQKVQAHPQVGADIIATVPFPYPVAPLILSHHERWDGRGYPSGLKGDNIPLGARILCLVDYFGALTSDRPYHEPMAIDAAVTLIEQEAGKALDPRAVEAFLRILPRVREEAEAAGAERSGPVQVRSGPGASPGQRKTKSTVFDDIAVAHGEIYGLYEIAQTMGTSLGVSDSMALIASKLTGLVPFSACTLFLYDEATDTLRCQFATGTDFELMQQLALKNGQGLTGWVARNRRSLVNARPSSDLEAAGSSLPTTLQSALVCPLVFEDRMIGTLAVYHTSPSFYQDDHRRLLDRVCEQAAAVINNAIVYEQTHEASLTDSLTNLPNTRFMVTHLTRELARAERLNTEVSLVVLDLDDFKEINDTHGHHIGDRALREVAHVLRGAIRPYDICVRYAGDEFIVVLAGCGWEEAENKRQELQQAVDAWVFEVRPGTTPATTIPLSISAGAAVFPHDGDTYESLLAKADSRMYRDKIARKRVAQLRLAGDAPAAAAPSDTQAKAG
ncbi:MAG TPA: HD domain-containing phosphohydrolase [Vicinamibacterales bacterium]|nr:HD domain-containing phosphohydrolase [Vicinamibacterales bacterium]